MSLDMASIKLLVPKLEASRHCAFDQEKKSLGILLWQKDKMSFTPENLMVQFKVSASAAKKS